MSKRMTDSNKWDDGWFSELSNADKLFWVYLCDKCDHAGIWKVNWRLVKFHIKDFSYDKKVFSDRIIEVDNEKWFVKGFVNFQYGELNKKNRVHASVIGILEKEGACKGLARGLQGTKDKDKDKEKDKAKEKEQAIDKEKAKDKAFCSV